MTSMMAADPTSFPEESIHVDVAVASGPADRRAELETKFGDIRSFVGMDRRTMLLDGRGIEKALAGIYPDAQRILVEIGHRPGVERIAVAFVL